MPICFKSIVPSLLATIFLVVLNSGCTDGNSSETSGLSSQGACENDARPVKAIIVGKSVDEECRSFPGVVQPARETRLGFRVGGPLTELEVQIGQELKEGELIARIDARDFELRVKGLSAAIAEARASLQAMKRGARPEDLASLEGDLAAARSQLSEAKANFERYRNLYEEKAVSRAAYDSAKTAFDTAQARLTASENALAKGRRGARKEDIEAMESRIDGLEAELSAARNALADTELRAPFDGTVHEKCVENFETVSKGDPIVSLMDMGTTEVRTSVPQAVLEKRSSWESVRVAFDAYPDVRVPAAVKEIGRKTQGPAQSFPLILLLKGEPPSTVLPGTAAKVFIAFQEGSDAAAGWKVPASAVFAGPEGDPAVWRVLPDTMTIQRVPIQTLSMDDGTVRIMGELTPGDRVVTAGARFLREGQKVRLLNLES